jgi:hypothetical protein
LKSKPHETIHKLAENCDYQHHEQGTQEEVSLKFSPATPSYTQLQANYMFLSGSQVQGKIFEISVAVAGTPKIRVRI